MLYKDIDAEGELLRGVVKFSEKRLHGNHSGRYNGNDCDGGPFNPALLRLRIPCLFCTHTWGPRMGTEPDFSAKV